ncbi:hypothetical protein GCM10027168_67430 [Streptomyces capparidis]
MSCGNPHETDCAEVLDHLYEYLDNEMAEHDYAKFREHFDECHPCLEKYGLEQAVKKLVKRCCGSDAVPSDLRGKVLGRIEAIRAGQVAPVPGPPPEAPGDPQAGQPHSGQPTAAGQPLSAPVTATESVTESVAAPKE